jgi:hypothetical protein
MGFYFDVIHTNIPDDVVEITQSEYKDLLRKNQWGMKLL